MRYEISVYSKERNKEGNEIYVKVDASNWSLKTDIILLMLIDEDIRVLIIHTLIVL